MYLQVVGQKYQMFHYEEDGKPSKYGAETLLTAIATLGERKVTKMPATFVDCPPASLLRILTYNSELWSKLHRYYSPIECFTASAPCFLLRRVNPAQVVI
jgi:hypothetical protein